MKDQEYFASLALPGYRRFIKGGVLDEVALVDELNLSEAQIPLLKEKLVKAGMLKEGKAGAADDGEAPPAPVAEEAKPKRTTAKKVVE